MSGSKGGVQRLIQNESERVIPYVHCFNHQYHLVIVALIGRITFLGSFFDQIEFIHICNIPQYFCLHPILIKKKKKK